MIHLYINGQHRATVPNDYFDTPEQKAAQAEIEASGIQWGDVVAWATKKLGMNQCAKCKARQLILNHIKELGVSEAIRQIREVSRGL